MVVCPIGGRNVGSPVISWDVSIHFRNLPLHSCCSDIVLLGEDGGGLSVVDFPVVDFSKPGFQFRQGLAI